MLSERRSALQEPVITAGTPEQSRPFSELVMFTGPELLPALFGAKVKQFWATAFRYRRCCFSYEHTLFIGTAGKPMGIALVYDFETKRREDLRSTLIILRHLRWTFLTHMSALRQSGEMLKPLVDTDLYVSNLAVYPEYRSQGYGAKLIEAVQAKAAESGCNRIVLDVETDKKRSIDFYERHGFVIYEETPVLRTRDGDFRFFKMVKLLP